MSGVMVACGHKSEYDASGNFEATDVTLSAATPGKVLRLDVEEGDTVMPGQTVALIDTLALHYQKEQLAFRRSASDVSRPDIPRQLAALQRELEKQLTERRRLVNLLADGAATVKQLDDIDAAIKILRDRIAAQESSLANTTASINESAASVGMQIRQLEHSIAECSVQSPMKGTVVTKYCEAGEYAVPAKPLVTIANLDRMYLRAYFTSAQLADLRQGQKVTVIADFGGDRRREYPGTVTWISPESEFTPKNIQTPDSRSNLVYAVKIAVDNDGYLKIGGFGNVRL